MKSFLEKSKRALVLLLTGAMIATSVPSTAFAATVEPDEDVIFEEGADAVEALGVADEEPVVEEAVDPVDPDDAKAEVKVTFAANTAAATLFANIYDYNNVSQGALTDLNQDADIPIDPEKDYVIVVEPVEGKAFDADALTELVTGSYKDYSTKTTGETKTVETTSFTIEDLSASEAGYYNKGTKKVTVPSTLLMSVFNGIKADGSGTGDGVLTLSFGKPATFAKWKISGFDLKDLELKADYNPSNLTLTNGSDKELDLANVIQVGSLDIEAFKVKVLVYDENDKLVANTGNLTTVSLDDPTDNDPTKWVGFNALGTEVWANYNESGHKGKLQIDSDVIDFCYNKNYKIYVDVTAGGVGEVSIKITSGSEDAATFATDGGTWSAVPTTTGIKNTGHLADDLTFTVTKKAPFAYINSVTWTVDGKADDAYKTTINAAEAGPVTVTIPATQMDKGNIVIDVKGAYAVAKQGGFGAYRIVDKNGKDIGQVESGKDLTFQIVPTDGHVVNSVNYRIGTGTSKGVQANTDGTYTISASEIEDTVTLNPDIAETGNTAKFNVKAEANIAAGGTVTRLNGTTTITSGGINVTKNDPLFFVVTTNPGYIVESVSYSMGSTTFTPATPAYGADHGTYKIDAVTGDVTIKVVYRQLATIFASSNKNVKIDFADPGKSTKVAAGTFTFTVEPVAANIEVKKVCVNTSESDGGTEVSKTGGTVTLAGGSSYYVYVETEETIDVAKYKAEFDVFDPKIYTTYAEGKPETTLNIVDQTIKLVMGEAAETFTVAYYKVKDGKLRDKLTAANSGDGYYVIAPETTDIVKFTGKGTKDKFTIEPNKVGDVDVTVAYKLKDTTMTGNTFVYPGTIKVVVTQPYTDLHIVADRDTSYVFDTSARADKLDVASLEFWGTDVRTEIPGTVNLSNTQIKSLVWSFDPSTDQYAKADYKHAFTNSQTGIDVTTAGTAVSGVSATNTTYVSAATPESVKVKAVLTYKDGSEVVCEKELTFINALEEDYFMTRTIDGAKHEFNLISASAADPACTEYGDGTSGTSIIELGLNTDDKKVITVKYDLYRVVKTSLGVTDYDNEAEVKKLLADGDIVKVDNATVGTSAVENDYATKNRDYLDDNEYVKLEPTTDEFKITALKAITNGNHVRFTAPDITISGVNVPTLNDDLADVTVTVSNKIDSHKVELITVDDQSKDAKSKVVNLVQTLNDTYINSRKFSKVAVDLNADGTKEQIGYEFLEIADDVSFKLPEETDFATKPYSKKILLGWAESNWSDAGAGTIKDTDVNSIADNVVAPGSYVTVNGNTSYKAIWCDKYVPYTGNTVNKNVAANSSSGKLVKLYDTTKAYTDSDNKIVYPEEVAGTIYIGDEIPVVAGVAKVTGVKAGGNDKVYNTSTGVVVAQLAVEEEFKTADFTLTAKGEDSEYNLDTSDAGLGAGKIKTKSNAVSGTATVVTAEWTDTTRTDSTDKFSQDVNISLATGATGSIAWTDVSGKTAVAFDTAKKNATMVELGVPATVQGKLTDGSAVKLVAATAVPGSGESRYYNYNFTWTSETPSVATVEAGKAEQQDIATITPVSAGTSKITLVVTKSGREIAKKEFNVNVAASDVVITLADNEGNTNITEVEAHAGATNADVFKIKATDKAGNALHGSFGFGVTGDYSDNKVIDFATQDATKTSLKGDANGYVSIPVATKDFIGTDTLHVTYTVPGDTPVTYFKDIKVKTYYSVTLAPVGNTWITKGGVKQVGSDGKTAIPVEIKLFESDMKDVADNTASKASALAKKDFTFKAISLEGYSAVYDDGTTTKKEFSNWIAVNATSEPVDKSTTYKENATISKLVGFKYVDGTGVDGTDAAKNDLSAFNGGLGSYVLKPELAETLTLTGVPGEVTMNYSSTPANNKKAINFTVDPDTYTTALTLKGEKVGFYVLSNDASDSTSSAKLNKTTVPSSGKGTFYIHAYTFGANTYAPATKTTWKAGVDKVSIYGPNANKPLASINLYINGLNYDTSSKKVQFFENGQLVKSDYKTVEGNTYYFDAEGNWIETTGITKINGKSVLIIDGVVATKGKRVHEGNTYFVGDNGVIQTGWLTSEGAAATASNGVYYADPAADGKLVTGVTTIDSKKYVFGTDNKVSRASASANVFEEVNGYYVNAAGEIAENGIFKVAGVDRLFRANGSIVLFTDTDVEKSTTDVEHGTITLNGIKYIIEKDTNKAVADDILYDATVTWTEGYPNKVTKGSAAPVLNYTVNYKSKNGNTVTPVEKTVVATTTDNFAAGSTVETVTFTATPDLTGFFKDAEGTTPATAEPKTITYRFKDGGPEGISDIWYAPTVEWTTTWPAKWTKDTTYPTMKYKVTYTSKESGSSMTTEELTALVTSTPTVILATETEATFVATADLSQYYTDANGTTAVDPTTIANATSSKKYIFKDGGAEGVAGTYTIKSKTAFTWGELPTTGVPTASLSITYTVTQEDGTNTTETVTTNATVTETTAAGDTKHRSFKAVAATMDEKNPEITDTKIYSVKSGSGMEGIVIEGLQDEYEYAGTPIQPAFYLVDYDIEDGVVLALGTDYTAKYTNNKAAGTGTITITGKGNYAGKNLTASFKIVDPFAEADKTEFADNVKKVVVSADGFTYDGTQKFPKTVTITTKAGETLVYEFDGTSYNKTSGDKEVLITVANNVKAGTATVGAQGKNDAKPKTGKFKIAPLDLSGAGDKLAVTINGGDNAVYEVKGVQPSVEVVYTTEDGDDLLLVQGQDYKLSFKNNKAAGTGTAILKGQKNCTKKKEVSFTIDKINLEDVDTDTVSIVALSGKKVSSVKPVVTDAVGNAIPTKAFKVSIFEAGKETALDKKATIPAEFDIKIEANDTVNLENAIEISGLQTVNDFGKAKIVVDKTWNKAGIAYTGSPIILTDLVDDDNANPFENGKITVKVGSATLVYGEDFEVAGYANNIKKGNMTFTLYGINKYAGSKSGKVKIVAKTIAKIEAE